MHFLLCNTYIFKSQVVRMHVSVYTVTKKSNVYKILGDLHKQYVIFSELYTNLENISLPTKKCHKMDFWGLKKHFHFT